MRSLDPHLRDACVHVRSVEVKSAVGADDETDARAETAPVNAVIFLISGSDLYVIDLRSLVSNFLSEALREGIDQHDAYSYDILIKANFHISDDTLRASIFFR